MEERKELEKLTKITLGCIVLNAVIALTIAVLIIISKSDTGCDYISIVGSNQFRTFALMECSHETAARMQRQKDQESE